MAEEMAASYERVPLFHSSLSFCLISPRLVSIIHHRCFKMINPFYLFPRPPNQCGLPHPSACSMEMSPSEKIYITSVDVWRRPIDIFSGGGWGVMSSANKFSLFRWHEDSEANVNTAAVASLRSCCAHPLPRRLYPRDLSSQMTRHRRHLTSEGETGKRGVPPKLLSWSLASASINSNSHQVNICS